MQSQKLSPEEQIRILGEHVIRARMHYDVWWFLEGEETRPLILETLNNYPEFFLLDSSAHFSSMVIRCALIWDSSSSGISLWDLANDRRVMDKSRFPEDRKFIDQLTTIRKRAQGLLTLRNQSVAHVNIFEKRRDIFQRAKVIPHTIPVLLEEWRAVINSLGQKINPDLPEFVFREYALNQFKHLIHNIGGPDLTDIGSDLFPEIKSPRTSPPRGLS
ncbi:hypothetical protein ACQKOE_06155 [Novosphingobium sp. NPDC080210]|uniref:AbiU2 domain-containing protein n=1 Tax=Novosphingobium sp. NPDC080210 TaxID=3390596 RepID=UPI003D0785DE